MIDWFFKVSIIINILERNGTYTHPGAPCMEEANETKLEPHCAACPFKAQDRLCYEGEKHPRDCPTAIQRAVVEQSVAVYDDPEIRRMAHASCHVERESYHILPGNVRIPCRPRLLEIIAFCKEMDYRRVGLIFCVGLRQEAAEVNRVFMEHGLDVISAVCKFGATPKPEIGVAEKDLLRPDHPESMCNPVGQAMLMNQAKVDFNVLLGLCVGHDSLVIRHLEAPVTILAVKDRMLGHNPLAAVYCGQGYFKYLKQI